MPRAPTRKTPSRRATERPAPQPAPGKRPRGSSAVQKKAAAGRPAHRRAPADSTPKPSAPPRRATPAERERRFNLLLQAACLKAGSAAAITTITAQVPLLGRLAPVLVDNVSETLALARIQRQLVRDVLELYDLDLSEPEERGVELLATAGNIGAQKLSRAMVDGIVEQIGGRYLRPFVLRVLPVTRIATEIAAAITGTYTVGKRAQVLCQLPGSGARHLGELLRGLSGIDQRRLFSWSGEALKLALVPFRSVLALIPGAR